MKHNIYKGLESPCMIKGFLSTDYWMYVGCCGAAFILSILSLRSAFTTGVWEQFYLCVICSILVLPVVRYKLKSRAKSRKFEENKSISTINNFKISKLLISREK